MLLGRIVLTTPAIRKKQTRDAELHIGFREKVAIFSIYIYRSH